MARCMDCGVVVVGHHADVCRYREEPAPVATTETYRGVTCSHGHGGYCGACAAISNEVEQFIQRGGGTCR